MHNVVTTKNLNKKINKWQFKSQILKTRLMNYKMKYINKNNKLK